MNNEQQESGKPLLVKLAEQLLKDQEKLDMLALKYTLGKAELIEHFEQVKKDMREDINAFRNDIRETYQNKKADWLDDLHKKLNALEDGLNKGVAGTKEAVTEQMHKISEGMEHVKESLKHNTGKEKLYYTFKLYAERLKLQIKLMEMELRSEKKELSNGYKLEMEKARQKINGLKDRFNDKREDLKAHFEAFGEEMRESYEHLKKAIQSL